MMSENTPFLTMEQSCDEAVALFIKLVRQAGLLPVCTFDLHVARQAQIACPCPHHGTDQCDCQMVVLLIYEAKTRPLTLVAHGYNGRTWFSVVDTPQQRPDTRLETSIFKLTSSLL